MSGLSKSTYYYEIGRPDPGERDGPLAEEIRKSFDGSGCSYGYRRVTRDLRSRGMAVNKKRVQRIMAAKGLRALPRKQRYRSYKGSVGKICPNVLKRDFGAEAPDRKWATDVSMFKCPFGKAYISPIIDLCTGEVISYDLSPRADMAQVRRMLRRAFGGRDSLDGLVFHSDQGWQYQHRDYQAMLRAKGITQSMSRKGNCHDNAAMESFFGVMKNEMFYGRESQFKTFDDLKRAVSKYIRYYNNRRIREKSNWMPPRKYRKTFEGAK